VIFCSIATIPVAKPKFKPTTRCARPSTAHAAPFTAMGFIVAEHRPFYGHDYFKHVRCCGRSTIVLGLGGASPQPVSHHVCLVAVA